MPRLTNQQVADRIVAAHRAGITRDHGALRFVHRNGASDYLRSYDLTIATLAGSGSYMWNLEGGRLSPTTVRHVRIAELVVAALTGMPRVATRPERAPRAPLWPAFAFTQLANPHSDTA